jgi:hypothetical protein
MHWYDSPNVLRVAPGIPSGAGPGNIQPAYLIRLSQKDEDTGTGDAGAAATTPARRRHRQKQHATSFICDTQPGHPIKLLLPGLNRKMPDLTIHNREIHPDRDRYDFPVRQKVCT